VCLVLLVSAKWLGVLLGGPTFNVIFELIYSVVPVQLLVLPSDWYARMTSKWHICTVLLAQCYIWSVVSNNRPEWFSKNIRSDIAPNLINKCSPKMVKDREGNHISSIKPCGFPWPWVTLKGDFTYCKLSGGGRGQVSKI